MTAQTFQVPFAHGDPAGPLRQRAHAVLKPCHPADYVEDALLAISELVQNVTQHTASDGVLIISWDDSSITVAVRDEDAGMPRPQPPDEHRIGGRGLLLVAGVSSSWGTTTHERGKTVWARVSVPAGNDPGTAQNPA